MNSTIRLGRIAGVPIGVSWSWFPVFGLFVWSLAAGVFPTTNPGLGGDVYAAMAVVAALLFFGSLLLHELVHALQARREGVEIDSITLWLLGGVARFRGRFASAGTEFRIAIAGPLVTAALATGFIALALLTHLGPAFDGTVAWLGYASVLVLVFNLLPALPLDGGRILRSALWQAKGDLGWATRIAATTGIGIGGLLIGAGMLAAVTVSSFSGIWLALIGWFVLSGARAEGQMLALQGSLRGFVVSDLMSPHPVVSQAGQTLRDFMAEIPAGEPADAYPVLDEGRPVGILPSPGHLAGHDWTVVRVRDRMVPLARTPVLALDEPAPEAIAGMIQARAGAALVIEDGRLAGIVSSRDITEALKVGVRRQFGRRPRDTAPPGGG